MNHGLQNPDKELKPPTLFDKNCFHELQTEFCKWLTSVSIVKYNDLRYVNNILKSYDHTSLSLENCIDYETVLE